MSKVNQLSGHDLVALAETQVGLRRKAGAGREQSPVREVEGDIVVSRRGQVGYQSVQRLRHHQRTHRARSGEHRTERVHNRPVDGVGDAFFRRARARYRCDRV